jgi:putative transposase
VSRSNYHTGVPMQHAFRLPKGAAQLQYLPTLSREACVRLRFLEYAQDHSVAATCRHYGIARSTFYRWRDRFKPAHLTSLETRGSRPHRCRQRTWTTAQVLAVRDMRKRNPELGKDKLHLLLREDGVAISLSMVGRILRYLRDTRQLHEPRTSGSWRPHARHKRPYAGRKPKDYPVDSPGDLVQLDTMELRPLPGVVRRHFTGIDCVSRWTVADVRQVATASTAREFLDQLGDRLPFPVRAIQVDGGPEFMAEFEQACRERGIRLFTLPPRSPKLNGKVERANRTYRNEFYEHYDGDLDLPTLQTALRGFEHRYNHQRPHQALGYATPYAYLQARRL